jgi:hypothetical protein
MAVPTSTEIKNLGLTTSLAAVCGWAGMDESLQGQWASVLGFPGNKVGNIPTRVLAAMPLDMYKEAMLTWMVGEGEDQTPASFYSKGMAMLVHSTSVKLCEPAAKPPAILVAEEKVAKQDAKADARKIKISNLIDPTDETEVPAASTDQLKAWYANYRALKHGEPLIAKDPSPDQIAALHMRIVTLSMEPYADFSLLTPYGRRVAKILRHRSWVMQEDGSYKPMDVPGPESFEMYSVCPYYLCSPRWS